MGPCGDVTGTQVFLLGWVLPGKCSPLYWAQQSGPEQDWRTVAVGQEREPGPFWDRLNHTLASFPGAKGTHNTGSGKNVNGAYH